MIHPSLLFDFLMFKMAEHFNCGKPVKRYRNKVHMLTTSLCYGIVFITIISRYSEIEILRNINTTDRFYKPSSFFARDLSYLLCALRCHSITFLKMPFPFPSITSP